MTETEKQFKEIMDNDLVIEKQKELDKDIQETINRKELFRGIIRDSITNVDNYLKSPESESYTEADLKALQTTIDLINEMILQLHKE